MRDLIATPSKHRKRCDMLRCDGMSVMEFARTNSAAGRLDLCQGCIDEISKYVTVVDIGNILTQEELDLLKSDPFATGVTVSNAPEQPTPPQNNPELLTCQYGCGFTHTKKQGMRAHEQACKKKVDA